MSIESVARRIVGSITVAGDATPRVELTPAAAALLWTLWDANGPLMFHQSGGCCDGSSPMCYPDGDFITSDADVLLGELDISGQDADEGADAASSAASGADRRIIGFWMSVEQFAYWKHTHLTVDVVKGRGSGFSLEAPSGVRFLIRSRLMDAGEPA